MVSQLRASAGSVAGSSGDGGVEYRRGVAAYAVAHGLVSAPLLGLDVPPEDARVRAVVLETEDAVDDLRVDFVSGWSAQIQAKRTLRKGSVLTKAVEQWKRAGVGVLNPATDRLVIVTGNLSGPLKIMKRALERNRLRLAGPPTGEEEAALRALEELLDPLSVDQRKLVLQCAAIWELAVEEPDQAGAQIAVSRLQHVVESGNVHDAQHAWTTLLGLTGRAARLRAGHDITAWRTALVGGGVALRRREGTLDFEWLRERAEEAVRQIGARYTPTLSVKVPLCSVVEGAARVPRALRMFRKDLQSSRMLVGLTRFDGHLRSGVCPLEGCPYEDHGLGQAPASSSCVHPGVQGRDRRAVPAW